MGLQLEGKRAVCEKLQIDLTAFSLHFSMIISMRYANLLLYNQGIILDGEAVDLV
jgi:hypothetical protein